MSEEKKSTPMVWGKDVKGIIIDRMIVGFGQKKFVLAEMTAEKVEFWEKKGVDFSTWKKEAGAEQTKEERTNERIAKLLELGFERNENSFIRGEEKVLLSYVEKTGVEKYLAFVKKLEVAGE